MKNEIENMVISCSEFEISVRLRFHSDFMLLSWTPGEAELKLQAQNVMRQVISTRITPERPQPLQVTITTLEDIIDAATKEFQNEPAVLRLTGEYCIVGDIHGNIDALIRIFEKKGYPPDCGYVFLGDYVDRGRHSCEVILLLYCLKFLFPLQIRMIRGNHEFAFMAEQYGFKKECESRLSSRIYNKIITSFEHLPVAALIGRNFCVHGGISPQLKSAEDIMNLTKMSANQQLGDNIVSDLVWSDPSNQVTEFEKSPRGCGVLYGADAVNHFTKECGIVDRIIRSHESCTKGFDWPFEENGPVLTVFSSCNYCEMMNSAAVATISDDVQSPDCTILPPLMEHMRPKRRVIFPVWLLDSPYEAMKPLDDPLGISDALSTVIEV
jgi:diadenosine tetraphosphatase ApaH/serine/threonine PP2A family protein phosphatase